MKVSSINFTSKDEHFLYQMNLLFRRLTLLSFLDLYLLKANIIKEGKL